MEPIVYFERHTTLGNELKALFFFRGGGGGGLPRAEVCKIQYVVVDFVRTDDGHTLRQGATFARADL